MPISYAGEDLLLEDDRIHDHLERFGFTDLRYFFINKQPTESNHYPLDVRQSGIPQFPDMPPIKINELYWPTGSVRFSVFIGLACTSTLKKIRDKIMRTHAADEEIRPHVDYLKISDEKNDVTVPMHLLPPRILTTGLIEKTDQAEAPTLWALPMVDSRFFFQFSSGNTASSGGSAWESLSRRVPIWYDDLYEDEMEMNFNDEEVQLASSSVTSDYADPSYAEFTAFDAYYSSRSSHQMQKVAHSIGRRLVRDLDGKWQFYSLDFDESQTRLSTNLEGTDYTPWHSSSGGLAGYQSPEPSMIESMVPRRLTCYFPKYKNYHRLFQTTNTSVENPSMYSVSHADTDEPQKGNRAFNPVVTNTYKAHFNDGESEPYHQSEMETLVQKMYSDWRDSMLQHFNFCFNGVKKWKPTGWDDAILYSHSYRNGKIDITTRVWSMPYDFHAKQFFHSDRDTPGSDFDLSTDWEDQRKYPIDGVYLCEATEDIDPDNSGTAKILDIGYDDIDSGDSGTPNEIKVFNVVFDTVLAGGYNKIYSGDKFLATITAISDESGSGDLQRVFVVTDRLSTGAINCTVDDTSGPFGFKDIMNAYVNDVKWSSGSGSLTLNIMNCSSHEVNDGDDVLVIPAHAGFSMSLSTGVSNRPDGFIVSGEHEVDTDT